MTQAPEMEKAVWRRVNEEPFEYAIQQGPHGDEFVKLLDGSCLRRSLSLSGRREEIARILEADLTAFFGSAPSHVVESLTHDLAALPATPAGAGERVDVEGIARAICDHPKACQLAHGLCGQCDDINVVGVLRAASRASKLICPHAAIDLLDEVTGYAKANADAARTGDDQDTWRAHERNLRRVRDLLSASPPRSAEGWQREVLEWAVDKFGEIARNPRERAMRFVEEAIELVQTQGVTDQDISNIRFRVFSRPSGDVAKEIGQVGMTFEAMAENIGLKVAPLIAAEIERVKSIPKEEWQRRHAAKVAVGAALPAAPLVAEPGE